MSGAGTFMPVKGLVAALGGPAAHAFGPAGLYAVLAGAMVVYAGITASAVGRAGAGRRFRLWPAMRHLRSM